MNRNQRNQSSIDDESIQVPMQQHEDQTQITQIADMVKGAIEPFAQSQSIAAQEGTKQTQILSNERTKMFIGAAILVGMILVIACIALFLNKDAITEKILIAVVSFLGGLGVGRQATKPR